MAASDGATIRRLPLRFATADDGVEICYQDVRPAQAPGAPVLVFQHGYTSYRGTWFNVVAKLQHKYRCIMLDMRGCGLSGRPSGAGAYTMQRFADDVVAVANAAGVDRFVYVGHSLGGGIGYELALSAKHKARLQALVLVTPMPSRGVYDPLKTHDIEVQRRQHFTIEQYKEYRTAMYARPAHILADEEEWTTSLAMDLRVPQAYYDGAWEAMCSFKADLAGITTPTLMVTADCDNLLGNNFKDYRSIKNAALHVFSRVSHSLPREVPFELASVIDEFVTHGVLTFAALASRGASFDKLLPRPKL